MSRTLVVGDPVLTLEPSCPIVPDGALIVCDGTVERIGPREELLALGPFDRVIGSPQHVVLPGFVNAHYHGTTMRSRGLYEHVFERQNTRVFRRGITHEDLHTAVLAGLIRQVRGGVTSTLDFSYGVPDLADFGHGSVLSAYERIGVRVGLAIVSRDQNFLVHADNEEFLQRIPAEMASRVRRAGLGYAWDVSDVLDAFGRVFAQWDGRDDRVRVMLAPDWSPACSDELYVRNHRLAVEYGTGMSTHLLETQFEAQFNRRRYGRSALKRLADLDVLGPNVSLAHFIWATDDDLRILRDSGSIAVNNPGSNLRLGTGIARVRDMLELGGRVAFGTDSISFSDDEDFFQELRLAGYLQRIPGDIESGRLDSLALLQAAAENGAAAIQQSGRVGNLGPGKDADLLLMDKQRIFWPAARYANTPPQDVIVDRANAGDIHSVMIQGRLVLDGGVFTTLDEAQVLAEYEQLAQDRLWAPSPDALARAQLAQDLDPYLFDFYRELNQTSLTPGYTYNTRSGPREACCEP